MSFSKLPLACLQIITDLAAQVILNNDLLNSAQLACRSLRILQLMDVIWMNFHLLNAFIWLPHHCSGHCSGYKLRHLSPSSSTCSEFNYCNIISLPFTFLSCCQTHSERIDLKAPQLHLKAINFWLNIVNMYTSYTVSNGLRMSYCPSNYFWHLPREDNLLQETFRVSSSFSSPENKKKSMVNSTKYQAPVVRRLHNAIQQINHYPLDRAVCLANT